MSGSDGHEWIELMLNRMTLTNTAILSTNEPPRHAFALDVLARISGSVSVITCVEF